MDTTFLLVVKLGRRVLCGVKRGRLLTVKNIEEKLTRISVKRCQKK